MQDGAIFQTPNFGEVDSFWHIRGTGDFSTIV
jgi:hypothetical protein